MSWRGGGSYSGGRGGGSYNNSRGGFNGNRGGGFNRGGAGFNRGGAGFNRGGGGFSRGGGRGGGGFNRYDQGPPDQVVEIGTFSHSAEDDLIAKCTHRDVPFFNAPIYLENKKQIGKIDEIFGPVNEFFFSVRLGDNMKASSFEAMQKLYIDPMKLIMKSKFINPPSGGGRGGRGRGGGRGGRGRGGRGGFSPRGGRGGFSPRGSRGGRGGFRR